MMNRQYFVLILFLLVVIISVHIAGGEPLTGTLSPVTISNSSVHYREPAISGNYLVWSDDRTGDRNIYLYNIATGAEEQITSGPVFESQPVIFGHYIVWQDTRFYLSDGNRKDIVLYDLDTGTIERIGNGTDDQINPSIDGDLVVWQDKRNGADFNIYLYSISTGTETLVTGAAGDQKFPRVSGNVVVWQDTMVYPYMVSVYDFAGNQTPFQPINFGGGESQTEPDISRDMLVWSDDHDEGIFQIFMMNLTSGEISQITPDYNEHHFPDIDGSRVVWLENGDVFVNDTAVPASETRISFSGGSASKENLRISGNRIIWHDSGPPDMINLFTIGPQQTCPDADFTISPSHGGGIPFTVTFTDTSAFSPSNPIQHWNWSFGDGNYSSDKNPVWTFDRPGNYDVQLIVDNPLCRNATEIGPGYRVTAGAAPVAGIAASTLSGMVPLDVTFTDTSAAATAWNWSFGDGTFAETSTATHTYTSGGTFTVRLTDGNEYGNSTATTTIRALTGANSDARTVIDGFVVIDRYGGQFLVYNGTALPGYDLPADSVLITPQLPDCGWQNITFRSEDGIGFENAGNETIMGNLTGVTLAGRVIQPGGLSEEAGSESSVFCMMDLPSYPVHGAMNTQLWEGALPEDLDDISYIAHQSGYSHVREPAAYTVRNRLTHFAPSGPAKLYVSVNSSWSTSWSPDTNRNNTFLVRIGDDGYGQVLPTRFLYNDPVTGLDYFEASSPLGLSTFVLTQLAGSGNPLQLITLSVTSHANQQSNTGHASDSGTGSSAGGQGAGQAVVVTTTQPAPAQSLPALPPERKTAKVYTSPESIVSQATELVSADSHAILYLGTGIIAKDSGGDPLTELWIESLPAGNLPEIRPGSSFTFAGLAYEIGPDGAGFSPPLTLTLPVPSGGNDYSVKWYDRKSGSWLDLPATSDPAKGTVTAELTHLCTIALFAETPTAAAAATPAATMEGVREVPQAVATPPATAVSVFANMTGWVIGLLMKNILIVMGLIAIAVIAFFVVKRRSLRWED